MREEHALDDPPLGEPGGEGVEGGLAQGGPLDAAEGVVIGEEVEIGEGFEIRLGPSALEAEGVRLDAVEEGGGQALGDLDVGGAQVVGENRRGRPVGGPDVADVRAHRLLHGMVVDDEVDLHEALLEEGGLDVHHGHPVEAMHLSRGDRLHVDVEDLAHGDVLGSGDGAEGADGRSRPVAAQQGPEGERGRDGVGVGIVLHQDENAGAPSKWARIFSTRARSWARSSSGWSTRSAKADRGTVMAPGTWRRSSPTTSTAASGRPGAHRGGHPRRRGRPAPRPPEDHGRDRGPGDTRAESSGSPVTARALRRVSRARREGRDTR